MSSEFESVVAIVGDPHLGAMLSLVFGRPGFYFALLEPLRLGRPDVSNEVIDRFNLISLAKPREVLLVGLTKEQIDSFLPDRSATHVFVVLDGIEEILSYLERQGHLATAVGRQPGANPYIGDLLGAAALPERLATLASRAQVTTRHPIENGIVCTEPALTLMSLAAANYAWAHDYAFRVLATVPSLSTEETERHLLDIDRALSDSAAGDPLILLDALTRRLDRSINRTLAWPEAVPLCFFTAAAPYGILFPRNPTCHVLKLEAGVTTAFSVGWALHEQNRPPKPCLTTLFVDPLWPDITSETEQLIDLLPDDSVWTEQVVGPRATCRNIELYLQHFPYDLAYVSSHGAAPKYRWNRYAFLTRDGSRHELETHEFEFFAPYGGDVMVTQKIYPLTVDGIPWEDKTRIAEIRGGEVLSEFLEKDHGDRGRADFRWVTNQRVEGIALPDGVFFGLIWYLAGMGHPIVVLNCCSMWTSLGTEIMHGRARACIATLWSVSDSGAVEFGQTFMRELLSGSIIDAAFAARRAVPDSLSATAYVCFTWPHTRAPRVDKSEFISSRGFVVRQISRCIQGLLDSNPRTTAARRNAMDACAFLATRLTELLAGVAPPAGPDDLGGREVLRRLRRVKFGDQP